VSAGDSGCRGDARHRRRDADHAEIVRYSRRRHGPRDVLHAAGRAAQGQPEEEGNMELENPAGDDEPSSEVTFNDDETEALTDSPSIQADEVDLGAEQTEDEADAKEKEAEAEDEEGDEEEVTDIEDVKVGDEEEGDEEEEEEEEEEEVNDELQSDAFKTNDFGTTAKNESLNEAVRPIYKQVLKKAKADRIETVAELSDIITDIEKNHKEDEGIMGGEFEILKKTLRLEESVNEAKKKPTKKKKAVKKDDEEEAKPKGKGKGNKKVFLKKKAKKGEEETEDESKGKGKGKLKGLQPLPNKKKVRGKKGKKINEDAQILDTVSYEGDRSYVLGKMSNGDLIVQVSATGQTKQAKPDKVKVLGIKAETMKPQFKFDKETQKVLFEQLVSCGIFMGNTPIKTSNCFVMYSDYTAAKVDEKIKVLVENEISFMPKDQVRVFENPNDFANPDHYVEGVVVETVPETGEEIVEEGRPVKSVLINAIDYTQAIGDADPVRVLNPDTKSIETYPKEQLRTLAV